MAKRLFCPGLIFVRSNQHVTALVLSLQFRYVIKRVHCVIPVDPYPARKHPLTEGIASAACVVKQVVNLLLRGRIGEI